MKFGNFLFPDCRDPDRDGVVIDETLGEAWLSDELGVDVIWLAEHHFDGICAYVDPISFAGALATSTRRSKIGFAVVQTALHHPVRLAEQLAVLDNITKGRLVVGLGRGSSYNIYDYQGFGIDHHEAQERLEPRIVQARVCANTAEVIEHDRKRRVADGGLDSGDDRRAHEQLHMPRPLPEARKRAPQSVGCRGRVADAERLEVQPDPADAAAMESVELGPARVVRHNRDAARAIAKLPDRLERAAVVGSVHAGLHDNPAIDPERAMDRLPLRD